jgi:uncharacterized protein (TIGR03083 family)
MGEWDATTFAGKPTILRVVRQEADKLFEMVSPPEVWDRETACDKWTTRDVVGHLVDTIEGYFAAFDAARSGAEAPAAHGLLAMSDLAGSSALGFRNLSQAEMLDRLHADFDKVMAMLEDVNEQDWTGLIVTHPYMGPVPAYIYAAGQLMDFAVHSWDIREKSGRSHALSGEAADLLVPFMFVIWMYTIKPDADTSPFELGVRILGGENAGDTRVAISPEGMTLTPGSADDLASVLEFDASSMVLTTFGRCNTGTVRGDIDTADRFLNLFHRI